MNKIIVGMGEALWDCLPEGKKIGGAPANFAYHASQFGFDSRVVSAVGADADGDEILDVFARKGLRTQIERVPYPTGTVQVTLDAVGVPCYEIYSTYCEKLFVTECSGEYLIVLDSYSGCGCGQFFAVFCVSELSVAGTAFTYW